MIIACAKCGHLHNDASTPFPNEVIRGQKLDSCEAPATFLEGEFECVECGSINSVTLLWGVVDEEELDEFMDYIHQEGE